MIEINRPRKGGHRPGSGRPPSVYGPTIPIRVPLQILEDIIQRIKTWKENYKTPQQS